MMVKCKGCGRQYNYKKDEICPSCGAYNRPPHREIVDADGTVHKVSVLQEKVCYEQKECHEAQVRPTKKAASVPDFKSLKRAIGSCALRNKPQTPQRKRATLWIGIVAALISALGPMIDELAVHFAGSQDPEPQPEVQYEEVYHDFGEVFTANGLEIKITDARFEAEEVIVEATGADESIDGELCWEDSEGCYRCQWAEESGSRGLFSEVCYYKYDMEDAVENGYAAGNDGYLWELYEYPDADTVVIHYVKLPISTPKDWT